MNNNMSPTEHSIRRHLFGGMAAMALLVICGGGLAMSIELSGAVIAEGNLVVNSNVKKIQHPTGGVVGEVRVQDGDIVTAGAVVVRLDDTVTRANLAIVVNGLIESRARVARLEAERIDSDKVLFPSDLVGQNSGIDAARAIDGETNLFELRRTARAGQKAQLKERTAQLLQEVQGFTEQLGASKREVELIGIELEGVRELWRKNLVPLQRVVALERDAARVGGERGRLIATIAQTRGKISEIELQVIQIDQDLRSEVAKELREVQGKIAELNERKITAEDQLKRVDIRAPQDGIVHQSTVHTVGGVINPGEVIMLIVPNSDILEVEAKLAPQDIDQVRLGQPSTLRLSAFNQRTTPELNGIVSRVSPDLITDTKTGANSYLIRIKFLETELTRLDGVRLVPGMPVEAFIGTGDRTVISYLTKPFTDQVARAFRSR